MYGNSYMLKSLESLFRDYADENTRINQEDREQTQRAITKELYRRMKAALELLEDATTEKEAMQIYKQFIEH